jgi:hypothetical protein
MGLAGGTVRKFADAETFPERAVRAPGPSILDLYLAHLEARCAAGCENAMTLWRCGAVALWRCGAVALWRCGAVARTAQARLLRNSETDPPLAEPTAHDTTEGQATARGRTAAGIHAVSCG